MVLSGALGVDDPANASAGWRTWHASVGNGWPTQQPGSNGVATIDLQDAGDGVLHLELKNLVRNARYNVTLFKGPFMPSGATWSSRAGGCLRLSDGVVIGPTALRSTTAGTIVRSLALSARQMAAISALPRRIAIMVGTGRLARCGGFELVPPPELAPSPGVSPSPTVEPSASSRPACSDWPAAVVDILAVLATPENLCLVRYPTVAEAPAFMRGVGGMFVPDPPTVYYVPGVAGSDTAVLAHEVCHAHQDRVARDEGQTDFGRGWYMTAEGADYLDSTGWHLEAGAWVEQPDALSSSPNPLEDNAWTCALWFDPSFGPHYLRRWAPIRFAWAQRWLPLPSFIRPWQPAG